MTEGLAVVEEQSPLQWQWVPMLYDAVTKKKLFAMRDLTWGFVRPRKPSDRQLAYAQSYWICTYIDKTYGRDSILQMLAAFKAGKSEDEVFTTVLHKSTDDFSKEFFAWTEKQIEGWGYDSATNKKVEKLEDEAQKLMDTQAYDQALELWQQVNELHPMDKLPHMRLAACLLKLKRTDDAVKHLEALQAVELKDNRYAKAIARIYRDENKPDRATIYAKQAVYIDPYDDAAHELLAEIYKNANNAEGLQRETRVIAMLNEWRQMQKTREESPAAD